ncbi:hypothetical protein DNTS_004098, partial [Danionella cerebrum]
MELKERQPPHLCRLKAAYEWAALCSMDAERSLGFSLKSELVQREATRSVNTLFQMQPLMGALPCAKGHLQSISLERKLCNGLCHCGWLKVRRSPLVLRLSSVTGILGWIIR